MFFPPKMDGRGYTGKPISARLITNGKRAAIHKKPWIVNLCRVTHPVERREAGGNKDVPKPAAGRQHRHVLESRVHVRRPVRVHLVTSAKHIK